MTRPRNILIAGAGAIGSSIAFVLARAGHIVTVVDPAPVGANASGVAAGMLAPAFESVFDQAAPDSRLLFAARRLWPEFSQAAGVHLARDGAIAVGSRPDVEAWQARLQSVAADCRLLAPTEVAARAPGLAQGLWGVQAMDDWRIDPRQALRALRGAAVKHGARFLRRRLTDFDGSKAEVEGQRPRPVDLIVLATGAARGLAHLAPELARLEPIKGHILRARGRPGAGPVIRGAGVYLCPSAEGLILGASMEAGRDDTAVEAPVVTRLIEAGAAIAPRVRRLRWRASAGVRGAAADGLPLVGFGQASNVVLAVGARRNGWLLAPAIATVVADLVEGHATTGPATHLDPGRGAVAIPG